jgi:ABC-type transport system involved in multi-copper enzyme maturation permease subunit/regulation of enolase protein 1 (concanavalin A-like superfamily)
VKDFGRLVHAEWTKFRTVRGWVIAMAVAAMAIIGLGLMPGQAGSCGRNGPGSECVLPVGPGGQEVTDSFTFVHQTLAGDGTITVRVTELTGQFAGTGKAVAPWAKAGIIIKDGTRLGSTYAAVMVTGSHGVRMQYDYTHDRAGQAGVAFPRWLRLTRNGDTVTGYESADGTNWATVDSVRPRGLPSTVEIGLFATSPQYAEEANGPIGGTGVRGGPTRATATFDHLDRGGTWTGDIIGGPDNRADRQLGGFEQTADGFTVTGSGDIAPAVAGASGIGTTITQTLVGTFAGLVIVVVLGTMFVTAEYRRGLIRTTLAAGPTRGRTLAAKAVVIGGVAFLTGLVAAAVVVTLGQRILRGNGVYVHPASALTELRVVAGTATLLAVSAVLALGLGTLLRRGVTAVTVAVVVVVLPYLLAVTGLPSGPADWLLRVTPAAAFALQQSAPEYSQVANLYLVTEGYFPLSGWAGFGVLAAWAALALGLAAYYFRRRDA